jgi:uncharacterized OB-fold protein
VIKYVKHTLFKARIRRMTDYIDFSKGPLPDVDDIESAPFWEGTCQGELRFPKCGTCGRFHWYPCVLCPFCHSSDITWQKITNRPKVYTWTCVRRSLGPVFNIRGPHIVALVEFDKIFDIYFVSNLVDCQPEDVYIGMPLEVVFQKVNDRLTMPLFKPLGRTAS